MIDLPAIRRRIYRWRYENYFSTINHEEVVQHVQSEGRMTSRFSFMVTMSCGIAILGLLLSSPAVVIGAMLISPLMSPIMNMGFSLCLLNPRQFFKALEAIFFGTLFALAISACIVHFSPLTDATPEILARTHPNLFDLLVALLSGLAGCYAMIQRKGETLVGVAIATALMPPLAVVGYGIAIWNFEIAGGAFMLFMTNLLTIALSATMLAKWYGFGREHGGAHTLWQSGLIIAVFALLSLPLGHALTEITYQTYATRTARQTLRDAVSTESRINLFSITFPTEGPLRIDAVVLTPSYNSKARKEAETKLAGTLGRPVQLRLDQIVLDQEQLAEAATITIPENTLQPPTPATQPIAAVTPSISETIQQKLFFPVKSLNIDEATHEIRLFPRATRNMDLSAYREMEARLKEQYPDWELSLIPPPQSLPPVYFNRGKTSIAAPSVDMLQDMIWTLRQWDIDEVEVLGFASTEGERRRYNNQSLALARAMVVANLLQQNGFTTEVRTAYRSLSQKEEEKKVGTAYFQRVEVHLPAQVAPPETLKAIPERD